MFDYESVFVIIGVATFLGAGLTGLWYVLHRKKKERSGGAPGGGTRTPTRRIK